MKRLWEFSKGYRDYGPALGTLEFQNMRAVPGLQAADLLVYEFRHLYHLKDTRPDLGLRHPWRTLLAPQEELHAKRLKYLPGWLLEMQGNGLVERGMHIISTDPQWDHMYQQLNPGFTNLKLDQARMRLLDKYIPFDPEKGSSSRFSSPTRRRQERRPPLPPCRDLGNVVSTAVTAKLSRPR